MVTDIRASLIMSKVQSYLVKKLEREHALFPSIILMDDSQCVRIEDLRGDFPTIVEVKYVGMLDGTNVTIVTMSNRNEEDDQEITRFIKEVTQEHQTEATGYFAQCVYKPMERSEWEGMTTDTMNSDPDCVRVFHNCFFVKGGDEQGHLMVTPYTLKDADVTDDFQIDPVAQKVATLFGKGWESPSFTIETRIDNPYK